MKEINIGRVLIKNRHKRGITQDELANHLGVSKGAVSKWETGVFQSGIICLYNQPNRNIKRNRIFCYQFSGH